MHWLRRVCPAAFVLLPAAAGAQARISAADSALAHSVLAELVSIRSISDTRATIDAARAVVRRLRAAGFSESDAYVAASVDTTGNVVARLRGRGRGKPVLLMAHLDVVPALREDWSTDPFTLVAQNGWWHGRGTEDDKDDVTILTTNLIRWKREGFVPDRDIVAVFTGDEETRSHQIQWFARGAGRRHIGDPEFALNFDGAGGTIYNGREAILNVQTAEKVYATYSFTVRNPGGHSSVPRSDNPIYALARALTRVAAHRFPIEITPATRLMFERAVAFQPDSVRRLMRRAARQPTDVVAAERLSNTPRINALLRSTCVATRLSGGHADNALPQTARATVNCRLMPGTVASGVMRTLQQVVADTSVHIELTNNPTLSPPSPVEPRIFTRIETVARRFWPGVVVAPFMSTGATDGAYVRNAGIPVYGMGGIFWPANEARAHGRDERVEIRRFYEGLEYTKAVIEQLSRVH